MNLAMFRKPVPSNQSQRVGPLIFADLVYANHFESKPNGSQTEFLAIEDLIDEFGLPLP
jgi:hypothetical protein